MRTALRTALRMALDLGVPLGEPFGVTLAIGACRARGFNGLRSDPMDEAVSTLFRKAIPNATQDLVCRGGRDTA